MFSECGGLNGSHVLWSPFLPGHTPCPQSFRCCHLSSISINPCGLRVAEVVTSCLRILQQGPSGGRNTGGSHTSWLLNGGITGLFCSCRFRGKLIQAEFHLGCYCGCTLYFLPVPCGLRTGVQPAVPARPPTTSPCSESAIKSFSGFLCP